MEIRCISGVLLRLFLFIYMLTSLFFLLYSVLDHPPFVQVGIHGQYFDMKKQELISHFLGHVMITKAHTAENIKLCIEQLLLSYKCVIDDKEYTLLSFLNSATTDNANNVVAAVKLMELTSVGCEGHKLNLATKFAMGGKFPRSGHPDYTPDPYAYDPEDEDAYDPEDEDK